MGAIKLAIGTGGGTENTWHQNQIADVFGIEAGLVKQGGGSPATTSPARSRRGQPTNSCLFNYQGVLKVAGCCWTAKENWS